MPQQRRAISYHVALAGLLFCLFGLASPARPAATVFPQKDTSPYRNSASFASLDASLAAIMEKARTQGNANDAVMGRIHDLAAALRYPLAGSDALAAFLDSLPSPPANAADALKPARETALQLARIVLNQEVENTRAELRAIRDLRAQESAAPGPAVRGELLAELENTCFAVGVRLHEFNVRCRDPRYTEPVKGESMRFLDEAAANAAQERRQAFLDRLSTDRENQDFIGGVISEKVTALRFPFTDTIKMSFFLERLFEAPSDDIARQGTLTQADSLLDHHMAVIRLALAHIKAISAVGANTEAKQRLLREAAELHQSTLDLLADVRERCRRAQSR